VVTVSSIGHRIRAGSTSATCSGSGQYYGPAGFFGTKSKSSGQSRDTAIQRHLWTVSEELT
jgi:hypothetical protein